MQNSLGLAGLPARHFRVIAADPPWHFTTRAPMDPNYSSPRHPERHYSTMSLDAIKALPVADLAAPDGCHLFLWVTGPMLPAGLEVMAAWGFKFSTLAFTWAKLKRSVSEKQLTICKTIQDDFHTGLGLTTRKNAEFVLLGRRGSPRRDAKDVRELIVSPVREHSRKPNEFYERVERYAAGPYVDLFAREQRAGWATWGNETAKFNA